MPAQRGRARPVRPPLPDTPGPLPRGVRKEIQKAATGATAGDVVRAVAGASDAAEVEDWARALELLEWAQVNAPRSPSVREALGIARYRMGDFSGASSELLAYRRLSGRQDQNHLLADCERALGRHERVREHVEAMGSDPGVHPDRVVEAWIVAAGSLADRGDLRGALALLAERTDLEPAVVESHHPRLWYAAGDLAERAGDLDAARGYFASIAATVDGYLDTEERLDALGT